MRMEFVERVWKWIMLLCSCECLLMRMDNNACAQITKLNVNRYLLCACDSAPNIIYCTIKMRVRLFLLRFVCMMSVMRVTEKGWKHSWFCFKLKHQKCKKHQKVNSVKWWKMKWKCCEWMESCGVWCGRKMMCECWFLFYWIFWCVLNRNETPSSSCGLH